MCALDISSLCLPLELRRLHWQVLQQVMTTQAGLRHTLKSATSFWTYELLLLLSSVLWVLGSYVIIKSLLCRSLVITVLALVFESTHVLCLDMHVNRALVLLGKIAVGALEATVGGAQIFERHWEDLFPGRRENSIFRRVGFGAIRAQSTEAIQ